MAHDADSDADSETTYTTDAWEAQSIAEERDAYPGHAAKTEGQGDGGLLRIGVRDDDEDLTRLSWDEFREEFEEKELALAYAPEGSAVEGDRSLTLVERAEIDA